MASIRFVQSNMIQVQILLHVYLSSASVTSCFVKNTELASADDTIYNLGSKVPVSQATPISLVCQLKSSA